MQVEMRVSGFDDLEKAIAGAAERAADLGRPLRVRATSLNTVIIDTFERGAGPNGESWAPLSEATKKRKKSSRILVDTGALRSAVNARATRDAIRFGVTGQRAKVGQAHQYGTGDIPRRPFLPLDESGTPSFEDGPAKTWWDRTVKMLETYIATGKLR